MRKITYIFLILIFASCSSQKNIDNRPSWVKQRPLDNFEYIGIGSASKLNYVNNYMEVAKQNALSDLSSEISVNISSTSVLSSIETTNNFRDEYTSVIKSKTIEDLEGYKMQASYDSGDNYWVYYTLSKEEYKRRKAQIKAIALNKSRDFYLKSIDAYENHELKSSLTLLFKALVNLKDYWNESTEVTIEGKEVLLGNEIARRIGITLSEIKIIALNEVVEAKIGKSISNEELSFKIVDKDSIGQQDIPILFAYSENRIINNRTKTNSEGNVSYLLSKTSREKEYSNFSCEIDIREIIEDASRDYMLVKLYSIIENPKVEVTIKNFYPSFYLESNELVLGEDININLLSSHLKTDLETRGIKLVDEVTQADFILKINADTKKVTMNDLGIYSTELIASVDIFSNDIKVFSSQLTPHKGRGNDFKKASLNAYENSIDELDVKIVYQIINELF